MPADLTDFNPRSRKGSDCLLCSVKSIKQNFNPRSRKGSDVIALTIVPLAVISIHAPAKGATQNPKHHMFYHIFQSTLPQRERRHHFLQLAVCMYFNPRSRKGSDIVLFSFLYVYFTISIHAPAKGATPCPIFILVLVGFQSTLPQRERQQYFTK